MCTVGGVYSYQCTEDTYLMVMPVSWAIDTLSALREKIEQQKKAVQATAAQVDALTQKQPDTNTSKFYPLPEGKPGLIASLIILCSHVGGRG